MSSCRTRSCNARPMHTRCTTVAKTGRSAKTDMVEKQVHRRDTSSIKVRDRDPSGFAKGPLVIGCYFCLLLLCLRGVILGLAMFPTTPKSPPAFGNRRGGLHRAAICKCLMVDHPPRVAPNLTCMSSHTCLHERVAHALFLGYTFVI